jgi:hypothetical protein
MVNWPLQAIRYNCAKGRTTVGPVDEEPDESPRAPSPDGRQIDCRSWT